MWENAFKDMGLPQASFEKLKFTDGYPKVGASSSLESMHH
jgi:hypothetical protein